MHTKTTKILAALVVIFFVLSLILAITARKSPKFASHYQAVFLENEQVYFGKITKIDRSYIKLTEVYYLKSSQALQGQRQEQQVPSSSSLTLVRLGDELPGSLPAMLINKSKVIFIEELKPDSSVIKAIKDFKNKQ